MRRFRLVRLLFHIRLMSMGRKQARQILKHEAEFLRRHFSRDEKVAAGKSKIYICT